MDKNTEKETIELEDPETPPTEEIAQKLGISSHALTRALLWGFTFFYDDAEQLLQELLENADPREDTIEELVSTALHLYAKAYTQEAVDYLLDHLNCKGHYLLQDIDYDLEGLGGYQLQFTQITGSPYYIHIFTVTKNSEDDYKLATETFLPYSEETTEKLVEYIEHHQEELEDLLDSELDYDIEEDTLILNFYGESIDEFPTIPQISKTVETILENIKL